MSTNVANYPRGSEWRKWDLHVHTKSTNKNDQFVSTDFNVFCETLFKKAVEKKIFVIGITDYFSIDNFNKVIEYQKTIVSNVSFSDNEKETIKNTLILPNVELRMLPVTDAGRLINIHCIFNPNYVPNIENDFFNALKHSSHSQGFLMNKQGMVSLGKQVDNTIKDESVAYKKGIDNFVVSHNELKEILANNNNLRNNVIVVVSNSNKDGNSGLQKHYDLFENDVESSLDDVRRSIYHLSDCIFSGNEKDVLYFLGKSKDSEQEVIRKCGSLKPCIHGSDAHTEDKLFNPDSERFCWIKADPTFEGLKQILHEPEERVKIQEMSPALEFEKSPFTEIQINDNVEVFANEQDNVIFEKCVLPLNNGLVSIIGGRGTGKSILIDYISTGLGQNGKKNYTKSDKITIKRQTSLKDDATSFIISNDPNVQFMYIPQSEIKSIVENSQEFTENIRETIGVIDDYIVSSEYREKADRYINEFHAVIKILESDETSSQQKKENIDKDIKRNNEFIANVTSQENKQKLEGYQGHLNTLSKKQALYEKLQNQRTTIEQFQKETNDILLQLNETLNKECGSGLKIPPIDNTATLNYISQIVFPKILELINEVGSEIQKTKDAFKDYPGDVATLLNDVAQYQNKVTQLQKQKNVIEDNERKFETIKQNYFKSLGVEIEKSINAYKQQIEDKWESFKSGSNNYTEEQKQLLSDILDEDNLKVAVGIHFDSEKMYQLLMRKLDGRSWNTEKLEQRLKISNLAEYLDFIKQTNVVNAFSSQIDPIRGYVLDVLFRRYNEFITHNIIVTSHDKNITKLSHGQQGTIYLRLKLAANLFSKTIIYDQPEDDLDNEFIVSDLVSIFKKIKKFRQVIIVSHNANLVVNADSEQVIISRNDDGVLKYVSGSLENAVINEQICKILEGGKSAFQKREKKYGLGN